MSSEQEAAASLRELINSANNHHPPSILERIPQASSVISASATNILEREEEYTTFSTPHNQDPLKLKHECVYGRCQARIWFPGFESAEDLWAHQQLHRCQWLVHYDDEVFRPCQYLPRNEDDFVNHVEYHLVNDRIPTGR